MSSATSLALRQSLGRVAATARCRRDVDVRRVRDDNQDRAPAVGVALLLYRDCVVSADHGRDRSGTLSGSAPVTPGRVAEVRVVTLGDPEPSEIVFGQQVARLYVFQDGPRLWPRDVRTSSFRAAGLGGRAGRHGKGACGQPAHSSPKREVVKARRTKVPSVIER
jgi:hypothetical protein